MASRPQEQRVAAYAVVLRGDEVLLSRLADRLSARPLWTLPGGGLDHGEDPRAAVLREVLEETGLQAQVGETARLFSAHQVDAWRRGRRIDMHALRIVYDGWVAADAPAPRTLEVGGSTAEAAWVPLASVLDGSVPTVSLVGEALAEHVAAPRQRVAAYALVVRDEQVLLTRNSVRGPWPGQWMLPGGGVEHGEDPRAAVVRETMEETGLDVDVGEVLDVASSHFVGTAPSGRREDFHGIGLVYEATLSVRPDGPADPGGLAAEPRVVEVDGTTDAAAWVALGDLGAPERVVRPTVRAALDVLDRRRGTPRR